MQPFKERIIRGERLFEQRDYEGALDVFEAVLQASPQHAGALNDAGLTCVELGRVEEGVTYLRRALDADPGNEYALYNLLDILVQKGDLDAARAVFLKYEHHIPTSEEKIRYRSAVLPETSSVPSLLSVDHPTGQNGVATNAMKVAFVCYRNDVFIQDIERTLARQHEVKSLHFNYGKIDLNAVQQLMTWADVTWFEWCDQLLIQASQRLRKTSSVICRLHRFEAYSDMPSKVDWSFVDTLVLVSPAVEDTLRKKIPAIDKTTSIACIPNGVDLDTFSFQERDHGHNLAFVCYLRQIKNPSLLLQGVYGLVQTDERYVLHWAGRYGDLESKTYFDDMVQKLGLQGHVVVHGWVDDMSAWLADKQYLISTSMIEGCPYNVIEAAARGLKPVVHNFFGAERLFPREWLFSSMDEFVHRIRHDGYDSSAYRDYVREHYSFTRQMNEIEALLSEVHPGASLKISPTRAENASTSNRRTKGIPYHPDREFPWIPLDEELMPFLQGDTFDNGLRMTVGEAESEVPSRIEFLEQVVKGQRILDVGCADHAPLIEEKIRRNEWAHKRFADAAQQCLGIDIDEDGIEAARRFGFDIEQLNLVDDEVPERIRMQKWDYLVLGEVLEHVGDPVRFLYAIRNKYEGVVTRVIVTVPNALRLANHHFAKQGLEVINSDHRYWFTPYTLAKVMTEAGLTVKGYRLLQTRPVTQPHLRELLEQRPIFREGIAMVADV